MISYVYDGSFTGLLTVLDEALASGIEVESISASENEPFSLFSRHTEILTDEGSAEHMVRAIERTISQQALHHIHYAFLSEQPGVELKIYHYLKLGLAKGAQLDRYITADPVRSIHGLSQRVGRERHRMLGLLRFRELQGDVFYAPCEPDANLVAVLAPHFVARMANQRWIIHDTKREIAAAYNTEQWRIIPLVMDDTALWKDREIVYQRLWQEFFHAVAIEGRVNPKLQRQHMPKKYWKHLVEKE